MINLIALLIICFSPHNDCALFVIDAINSAEDHIDMAAYSLTDPEIIDAVSRKADDGISVRIILDEVQAANKASITKSKTSVRNVCIEDKSGLMHNKFIVIDNKYVITGSYNFTLNARRKNAENLIVSDDQSTIFQYQIEFNNLWREYSCE